jgi:hypothetical protein
MNRLVEMNEKLRANNYSSVDISQAHHNELVGSSVNTKNENVSFSSSVPLVGAVP